MVILSMDLIRDLAVRRPGTPVLSVYVRTDPRDPAKHGRRAGVAGGAAQRPARGEPRGRRGGVPRPAAGSAGAAGAGRTRGARAERGRGLAWFRTADGALDHRFTLQVPPLRTLVCWDDLPFVSLLVDVVERGRPTGLVLVTAEAVRLLQWQEGRVTEPAQSLYEIEFGEWRDYHAPNATANFRACHPPCRWCRGGRRRWLVPGPGCGRGW